MFQSEILVREFGTKNAGHTCSVALISNQTVIPLHSGT